MDKDDAFSINKTLEESCADFSSVASVLFKSEDCDYPEIEDQVISWCKESGIFFHRTSQFTSDWLVSEVKTILDRGEIRQARQAGMYRLSVRHMFVIDLSQVEKEDMERLLSWIQGSVQFGARFVIVSTGDDVLRNHPLSYNMTLAYIN